MPIVVATPTVPTFACAPWATPADVCAPCNAVGFDVSILSRCLSAATDVLYQLSGRQFSGECVETVRPCAKSVAADHGRPVSPWGGGVGYSSGSWRGAWAPWGWCLCNRTERAGCYPVPEIALPGYPVKQVMTVKVDGLEMQNGVDYRVDDDRFLVRLPDPATGADRGWPCCQSVTLPDTAPGTFSVQYRFGNAPPVSGVLACAELGCQLALALSPQASGECKLPKRVTSLTRQGITAVVLDPMAFLDKGKTGLYDVDLFIQSCNPKGIGRRSTAWHPEMGRRTSRRVGTA